jgi:broad specificity phosphatase PhoE
MKTTMYLLCHAAAEVAPHQDERLHGRRHNPPLARSGVRQAELTRDFLAIRPIDACYSSPMLRALQTATIIASPHGLSPIKLDSLTDCDVGAWEGLDWTAIRYLQAGYPGGESLEALRLRVTSTLEELFARHESQAMLVVAHPDVNRVYLASLMSLVTKQAGQLQFDPCGISVIVRENDATAVHMLNASFHLQGAAA